MHDKPSDECKLFIIKLVFEINKESGFKQSSIFQQGSKCQIAILNLLYHEKNIIIENSRRLSVESYMVVFSR